MYPLNLILRACSDEALSLFIFRIVIMIEEMQPCQAHFNSGRSEVPASA